MRQLFGVALGAGLLWATSSVAIAADQYAIDPAHSTAAFAVKHLAINTVHGRFAEVSGAILYDEQDVTKSSVTVTIKAASINTDNAKRDEHLRSADFFDAAQFPDITFRSTRIQSTADGYLCVGTLTMHGVSKEVTIPFTILGKIEDPWGKTRLGVEASLGLNRLEYGIVWNKTLGNGSLVVGTDVKITLNVEAVQQAQ